MLEIPQISPELEVPQPMWRALVAAYSAPGRAYHNLSHLSEVLRRFEEVARDVGWRRPREVLLALLFHDAVYVPGGSDNEMWSAALAEQSISEWLPDARIDNERVAELIALTAKHSALTPAAVDDEAALFLDCDMAILGGEPEAYDAYEAAIAREYSALPREAFRVGRLRFLQRLLASERIFLSDYFHARLDGAARSNLRRAIQTLSR